MYYRRVEDFVTCVRNSRIQNREQPLYISMNRRQFLTKAGIISAALTTLTPVISRASKIPRSLSFYNTHTREKLNILYAWADTYDRDALEEINYFLRDFRTGDIHPIDPTLLDILHGVSQTFGGHGTFEVISGYRSPKTNSLLRKQSNKVAKRSLHMQGKAIDIRLTGTNTKKLQQCAIKMQRGGVGYYRKSDFVHIDTGRVRFW